VKFTVLAEMVTMLMNSCVNRSVVLVAVTAVAAHTINNIGDMWDNNKGNRVYRRIKMALMYR